MLRCAKPQPIAILIQVRHNKAVHQATVQGCIDSLQMMSGQTRDRIAISRALLGRISDRPVTGSRSLTPHDTVERAHLTALPA